jgi:hypothetical protein
LAITTICAVKKEINASPKGLVDYCMFEFTASQKYTKLLATKHALKIKQFIVSSGDFAV